MINALSELGYEVVASSGSEAETTWTMRREVPVSSLLMLIQWINKIISKRHDLLNLWIKNQIH